MSKRLMVLVGPPGSGKSTFAKKYVDDGFLYINQDSQGKDHLNIFHRAVLDGKDIVVDRMGFNKDQRRRYLEPAKKCGYETAITVLHESLDTCYKRCMDRKDHETIKDETSARSALNFFFTKYERVQDDEADTVQRFWPDGPKPSAIIVDLDGTLCLVEHRRHFVNPPKNVLVGPDGSMIEFLGKLDPVPLDAPLPKVKKDWKGFFDAMSEDTVNQPVADIIYRLGASSRIVLCSGRPDNYRKLTVEWLHKYDISYDALFMRNRADQRQDDAVKEVILDFEILTRYTPYFMLDDRDQVVAMWRRRGYTCLQVAPGNF